MHDIRQCLACVDIGHTKVSLHSISSKMKTRFNGGDGRDCMLVYLGVCEDIGRTEVSMHDVVCVEKINGGADLSRHHLDHLYIHAEHKYAYERP